MIVCRWLTIVWWRWYYHRSLGCTTTYSRRLRRGRSDVSSWVLHFVVLCICLTRYKFKLTPMWIHACDVKVFGWPSWYSVSLMACGSFQVALWVWVGIASAFDLSKLNGGLSSISQLSNQSPNNHHHTCWFERFMTTLVHTTSRGLRRVSTPERGSWNARGWILDHA